MYRDPLVQKYIDLITAKTNVFKVFYQGEPVRIPTTNLPCCIISKKATQIGQITNAEDGHEVGLTFTVVTDIRNELSTNENDATIVEGIAKLYDIIEGRNDDYTLKDTSLLDILRTNQLVDGTGNLRTDLSQPTRVDYGETLQNRDPEEWRVEARVEIVAEFIQTR